MEYEKFVTELTKYIKSYGLWDSAVSFSKVNDYEIRMECSGRLIDLFTFGLYGTHLQDLSFDLRYYYVTDDDKLMEDFETLLDDLKRSPQFFDDVPDELDFDSADEYMEYRDEYIEQMRMDYINEKDGIVEIFEEPRNEIIEIAAKYKLNCKYDCGELIFRRNDVFLCRGGVPYVRYK